MVFQIQLAKRQDAVPLTRDYILEREAELRRRELVQAPATTGGRVKQFAGIALLRPPGRSRRRGP